MSDLRTLQKETAAAIMSGSTADIARAFVAGDADAGRRLNIYRNNTFASLSAALKSTFPATARLADPRFFGYLTHSFILAHPPREACLAEYGAGFPRFAAGFSACRNHREIAAMAGFEWKIAEALRSPVLVPLTLATFTAAGPDGRYGVELQPSLRFVTSRWPLARLWANRPGDGGDTVGVPGRKLTRTAILRDDEGVIVHQLDAARFAFWRQLANGRSIEAAAARALARDPMFDLIREIALLFQNRLVTGIVANLLPH